MANKAISELPQASNVNNQDLFVLEQSGIAKKLTAETFITEQGIIDALAEALDGHGGISSVTLSSVSGRIRTYLITFTDETATTFQVLDGTSIDRIVKTSTAGLTDTYTVFMTDGTTTFFTVKNGADGDVTTATLNDALAEKAPVIPITTVSSATVTFADGADDMPMQSVLVDIEPVQDLSNGDPSPTNICPITGYTGVNVYRESAYDAAATAALTVSWQNEAGTVYSGTVDLASGVLTVTAILEVFNEVNSDGIKSQIDYLYTSASINTVGSYTRVSFGLRGDITSSDYQLVSSSYDRQMCNMLKHYFSYSDESSHWYRNTTLYAFFPSSLVGTTPESVISYLTSIKDTTPLSFWVPLTTPITYQLTPQQLTTLYGNNAVWTNIGDVTVTYLADTKKYITDLAAYGITSEDITNWNNKASGWTEIATITLDEEVTSYRIPIPATATEIEASFIIYRSDTTSTYLWIAPTTSGWSNHNIFNRYGPNTNTYWWGTCHVWLNNGYSSSILQGGGGSSLSNFFGVGNQGWMNGQAYIDFQSNPGICFNLSSGLGVGSTFTVRYR